MILRAGTAARLIDPAAAMSAVTLSLRYNHSSGLGVVGDFMNSKHLKYCVNCSFDAKARLSLQPETLAKAEPEAHKYRGAAFCGRAARNAPWRPSPLETVLRRGRAHLRRQRTDSGVRPV